MKQFLANHKDWVIDGNYSWCCYEERMEHLSVHYLSSKLLSLELPRESLETIQRRYKGRVQESMAKQGALNALIGNSSVGSFGMDEAKVLEKGIKTSTPPTPEKFIFSQEPNELHEFSKTYRGEISIPTLKCRQTILK